MTLTLRSFWLPISGLIYVCLAAAQSAGGRLPWLAAVVLPWLLSEVWRRTAPDRRGEDRTHPSARAAIRAVSWGAALWIAARLGPTGRAAFDAAANLGTGTAIVACLVALARIPSPGGRVTAPPAANSLDAAAFAGLLWGIATTLPAVRALLAPGIVRIDPLAIDYATTTAGIGSLFVLVAASLRLHLMRRLELGVGDRAAGALALSLTAVLVAVPAAALDVGPPDRILPVSLVVVAILCTWTAATPEPTRVSGALRGILAVMILGAPTTLGAGLVARDLPQHSGTIVLAASAIAIVVGLIARAVAKPLGPEQSRWLDALDAASRGALQPEPDAAIRAALMALRNAATQPGARPELYRNAPEEVLYVDIAGYLHVEAAEAPAHLYELALEEPERTLRAEALAAVQVRMPDVRPILAWFETRQAFSATVIMDEDGPLGFLLLPRGNRRLPMTLEEARAVRLLADRLSALLAVSSALARSRERELAAVTRADQMDDERQRLEHIVHHQAGRNALVPEREARRVRATVYSPKARKAWDEIERFGRLNIAFSLLTPIGANEIGWAAGAHLASPRAGGPFVVVDGAQGPEHKLELWLDPVRSPLSLSDGGTLVIRNVGALPEAIQEHVALTLSRKSSAPQRSSILPAGLVASSSTPLFELETSGRLSKTLHRWLGESEVQIPPLLDRAEDLRALVLDALSQAGLRLRGAPLGVDQSALRLLVEHRWPGNERELVDVLERAAENAVGTTVTATNLAAVRFVPELDLDAATMLADPAPASRRRARYRRNRAR